MYVLVMIDVRIMYAVERIVPTYVVLGLYVNFNSFFWCYCSFLLHVNKRRSTPEQWLTIIIVFINMQTWPR